VQKNMRQKSECLVTFLKKEFSNLNAEVQQLESREGKKREPVFLPKNFEVEIYFLSKYFGSVATSQLRACVFNISGYNDTCDNDNFFRFNRIMFIINNVCTNVSKYFQIASLCSKLTCKP